MSKADKNNNVESHMIIQNKYKKSEARNAKSETSPNIE